MCVYCSTICRIGSAGACQAGAEEVDENHDGEPEEYDRGDDVGDAFQTGVPGVVGPSDALEHRPYAVGEVEPQGGEPHEVDHHVVPLREGVADQRGAVGGTVPEGVGVLSHELDELHLRPEVEEVEQQTGQDDESQDEHVFRSPCHARLLHGDGIALLSAGLVVAEREDDGVEEVDQDAGGEHDGSGQGVPVGPEELTDGVVGLRRDDGRDVHRHVEEDEEHEETPRHAHY